MTARTYSRTRSIYVVGNVAFVADPASRSAWWKTHAAVAVVSCPTCGAAVGQLCERAFDFCRGSTHGACRRAARESLHAETFVVAHSTSSPSRRGSPTGRPSWTPTKATLRAAIARRKQSSSSPDAPDAEP